MANRKLPLSFPTLYHRASDLEEKVYEAIRVIVEGLKKLHTDVVIAHNFNTIEFVSANNQPTPEEGRIILWHDADAASGQPTHYLVVKMNGTTRTFRSVEQVP